MDYNCVRNNYTKLLRKRNTYQKYFSQNLSEVDKALRRVKVRELVVIVPRQTIFQEDHGIGGLSYSRIIEKIPAHVEVRKGLGKVFGKERENLKKYAEKVKKQRNDYLQHRREKEKLRRLRIHRDSLTRKVAAARVQHGMHVARDAARWMGIENRPEVVRELGAQIRPTAPELLDGWYKDPVGPTQSDVDFASSCLGVRPAVIPGRPASSTKSWRLVEETQFRFSCCDTCGYEGDGSPGYCPHCTARLRVYRKRVDIRPPKRKKRGAGSHMPA